MRLGRIGWIAAAVFCGALALMAAWAVFSWEDIYQHEAGRRDRLPGVPRLRDGLCRQGSPLDRGRRRYGWLALIVALSAWAVGEVVRMFEEVRVDDHLWHPSLTQAVLTVFPVAAYACLLLLGDLEKAARRRMVLDGIIVATSLFVVSWVCS